MVNCKICKTDQEEDQTICRVCKYPLLGTEKEQAVYVAKQVMQKSDVLESIKQLKTARGILFGLGGVYVVMSSISYVKYNDFYSSIFNIALSLVFIGFGFLTFKRPKIALLIPLILTVLYYLVLLFINPFYLWQGVFWKLIVLIGLGYGYFGVRKSDKILSENEYLASVFGFNRIKNK